MPLYAQVKNNLVVNLWDSAPPVSVGEDGWKNAVEQLPELVTNRQEYGNWIYDVSVDPIIVTREVIDLSVEERKVRLINKNDETFKEFINVVTNAPILYSAEEIANNKVKASQNKVSIEACSTHTELDELVLNTITLY